MRFLVTFPILFLNTVALCIPLYCFLLFKLILPGGRLRQLLNKVILFFANTWVGINALAIDHLYGIEIELITEPELKIDESYLILANHKSWVDILLLQKTFHKKTPLLRFFLKKELIWLPFLGLAFWALDFPFMSRYSKKYLKKHPEKAGDDLKTTIKTCRKISKIPFSLINFPEGTRGKESKLEKSPFKHLLAPKAGGLAFVLEAFEGNIDHIIDVNIVYENNDVQFFRFLNGSMKKVRIEIKELKIPDHFGKKSYANDPAYRKEFQTWLNLRWQLKDLELMQ